MGNAKRNVKAGRISVRVTAEQEREFEAVCQERRMNKSDVIRMLVEDYIRQFEQK